MKTAYFPTALATAATALMFIGTVNPMGPLENWRRLAAFVRRPNLLLLLLPLMPFKQAVAQVGPSVSITSPAPGTTFSSAQSVTISADVADSLANVTRVEFYLDSLFTPNCIVTSPPYDCTWTIAAQDLCSGSHIWFVYAYDDAGNQGSTASTFFVADVMAPVVSITGPADNTTFDNCATTVPITVTATDNCRVSFVEFYKYVNGSYALQGSGVNSPAGSSTWIFNWSISSANNGTYFWRATAGDSSGNVGVSTPITLNVSFPTVGPTVSITNPTSGTSFTISSNSQSVLIVATATEAQGSGVTHVSFYDGNTQKGAAPTPPYVYNWTFTSADEGIHNWTARAFDCAGNNSISSPVALTVVVLGAPVIIVQPVSQSVAVGSNVRFNVSATGVAPLAYQWLFNGRALASSPLKNSEK